MVAKKEAAAEGQELIVVSKKAMSVDVGPAVIAGYSRLTEEDAQAKELLKGIADKRYDLLASLTQGIVKAAENDENIDLGVYFGADSKEIEKMNVRLGIALGWRVATMVGEGKEKKQKIEYSEKVKQFVPQKDDDKEVKQRKRTVMSNVMHAVKKAAQAAAGIIESDVKVAVDKSSGTLKLTGPAIKKEFGQDSVLLNEKQKVPGKKEGETITLKAKPSFTQIGDMGARAHGAVLKKATNNHRGGSTTALAPEAALAESVKLIVKIIEKIKQPNDKQIAELEKLKSAVDTVLGVDDEGQE